MDDARKQATTRSIGKDERISSIYTAINFNYNFISTSVCFAFVLVCWASKKSLQSQSMSEWVESSPAAATPTRASQQEATGVTTIWQYVAYLNSTYICTVRYDTYIAVVASKFGKPMEFVITLLSTTAYWRRRTIITSWTIFSAEALVHSLWSSMIHSIQSHSDYNPQAFE